MNMGGVEVLGSPLSEIANVNFAVGPKSMGGHNLPADVQLVQFLLDWIMTDMSHLFRIRDRNGQVMKRLAMDTVFTARTFDAIRGFQSEVKRIAAAEGAKGAIATDGVVDASNANGVGTRSGTVYTIVWLNIVRQTSFGSPLDGDQVGVEPLHSALARPVNPNPLPPPPRPPRGG